MVNFMTVTYIVRLVWLIEHFVHNLCLALVFHIHSRKTMPRTTVELRWRVIALHDMGIMVLAISRQLGIKRSAVYDILKRHAARPPDVIQAYLQNASIDFLL